MILLRIDRFNESRRIVGFEEMLGNRHLFIGVGAMESAEIGRALRFEPRSPGAHREQWMDMIELRGARLDAVAITDLVDGTFRASVFLTQEGRSFDLPSRPADAIEWAARHVVNVWASEEVMELAAVSWYPHSVDALFDRKLTKLRYEEFGRRIATYPILSIPAETSRAFKQRPSKATILRMWLSVGATGAVVWYAGPNLGVPEATHRLPYLLASLGVSSIGLYGMGWFYRRRSIAPRYSRLEVRPVGLILSDDRIHVTVPWSKFIGAGRVGRLRRNLDGLLLSKAIWPLKGFALSDYERDWRNGEIGHVVRRLRPQLFGITPVDPEGGCPIF